MGSTETRSCRQPAHWKQVVARYECPAVWRSLWQVADTLVPYVALWCAMGWSVMVSSWITLLLAVPTAGLHVRLFVIFHDCGHHSFFASGRANRILGRVLGVLLFTPYDHWRHEHALHHATAGDLDRRGAGDVWTLTVEEYLAAPWWKRCGYRLVRNPLVLFGVAPLLLFVAVHRVPRWSAHPRARASVLWTDAALLGMVALLTSILGLRAYVLIQLLVLAMATSAGVWLFYVQHQFEGVYWARRGEWNYMAAALQGSSYYRLPRVLQWFTANIGFHHIHHLSPGIPNYRLEACANADPRFQAVPQLTLLGSLKAVAYRLWDEEQQTWVGYAAARARRAAQQRPG